MLTKCKSLLAVAPFLLIGCASKGPKFPSHDMHVFRGTMPHVGPEVKLEVDERYPTTIVFPIKVFSAYSDPNAPIRVEKDFEKIKVVSRPGLSEKGQAIRVDTVDGKQYRIRFLPAKAERNAEYKVHIRTANKPL